jgi:hypothetical protein
LGGDACVLRSQAQGLFKATEGSKVVLSPPEHRSQTNFLCGRSAATRPRTWCLSNCCLRGRIDRFGRFDPFVAPSRNDHYWRSGHLARPAGNGSKAPQLSHSPIRPAAPAICACRTTGIDGFVARTIARFYLTGKMAHDDLVCPATSSRLQSSGTPLALCFLHAKP